MAFQNPQVGAAILQAAQGIVQQTQNQQRLNLQKEQFEEQKKQFEARAKEQETTLRLKEQQIQINEQNAALQQQNQQFQQALDAEKLAVSQRKVSVQEAELQLKQSAANQPGGTNPSRLLAQARLQDVFRDSGESLMMDGVVRQFEGANPGANLPPMKSVNDVQKNLSRAQEQITRLQGTDVFLLAQSKSDRERTPQERQMLASLAELSAQRDSLQQLASTPEYEQVASQVNTGNIPRQFLDAGARNALGDAYDPSMVGVIIDSPPPTAPQVFQSQDPNVIENGISQYSAGNTTPLVNIAVAEVTENGTLNPEKLIQLGEMLEPKLGADGVDSLIDEILKATRE